MQRFIQSLDLIDDPVLIRQYVDLHSHVWPEVLHGIRHVGIERMDIFILGNRLVMIIEMADDIDFDNAMSQLALLPRQAEWEEFVSRFQICNPSDSSADKWKRMSQIFSL